MSVHRRSIPHLDDLDPGSELFNLPLLLGLALAAFDQRSDALAGWLINADRGSYMTST